MALSNGNADLLAAALLSAVGSNNPASLAKAKQAIELIYSHLKADILITLLTGTVVTSGGPTTQTGPAVPVLMTPA